MLSIGLASSALLSFIIISSMEYTVALQEQKETVLTQKLNSIVFDKNLSWTQAKPKIKELIIDGANPNTYEANPLFIATTLGDFLFVKWLLEHGANPHVASYTGTPSSYIQTLKYRKNIYPGHPRIEALLSEWMNKPEVIQEYESILAIEKDP